MGDSISKLFSWKKETKVLMVGLDAAGKTTMFYKIGWSPAQYPITIGSGWGWSTEDNSYKNLNIFSWDIHGSMDRARPLWRHYYPGTKGVILFVDSNDRDRVGEVRDELQKLLLEDLLRDACLLVFANKQDLPSAMSTAELIDRLDLESIDRRKWHIQGSCARTGDGLHEGLEWMIEACKEQKS
eukprot:Hpha_TRINITY_DN16818_c0_g7::TRINITY_DN16818_c0_g7_i1::g.148348::m.148348/K07937/ARF1; ADP-ribosylation factor 1